jgi:hypothetical protein
MLRSSFSFSLLGACAFVSAACSSNGDPAAPTGSSGTGGSASSSAGSGTSGAQTTAGTNAAIGGSSAGANAGSGGMPASAGASAAGAAGATGTAGAAGTGSGGAPSTEKFSFFVTSLKAMRELSGNEDGFGGDLKFGESGPGAGLKGADKICKTIAEKSMPGNAKVWRAFLSATAGENGQPVDAIDRVGQGPWYDRTGRLVAQNATDLITERPTGADAAIVNDLPNEDGVPNHAPDGGQDVDNHDVLTGTNDKGKLFSTDAGFTCNDWTTIVGDAGTPRCGHSWPRMGGGGGFGGGFGGPGGGMMNNWMSALNESGCAPGAFIIEAGPPGANGTESVGDGGGYGAIYCFALTP